MIDFIRLPDSTAAYGGILMDTRPWPHADADADADGDAADSASPCWKTTEVTS
ncbi:hypothetical protein [Streptomyces anulatus]|uniref:hypothetical protein n=1 Tax=Streptomyces anulatus TaxID=1892 RepID=UPI0035DDFD85